MTTHEQREQDDGVTRPAADDPTIDDENTAPTPEPEPAVEGHESSPDTALFADADIADLRARWASVQGAFVDDPKDCVQQADHLVAVLVKQLTNGFEQNRSRLEEQWSHDREASTEDLRVALMHYREFFDRLLGV